MNNNSNMLQLCRLCLVKDDVNIPIFEEQGDIRQIFLKISSCLPVKVSREDQLPKKICDGCSYKLDMLYEFWNTSANAEKQLLTWLGEAGMTSQMADGTISAVAQQIKPADAFVKQETIDPPDIPKDDDDEDEEDKDYMKQEESSNNVTEEPPPKRARRTAAVKAAIALDQNSDDDDDSGEPMTKVEDDSDDSDNDDHEPAFVDVPSTSADDQPGPSGVGKDGVEAPVFKNSKHKSGNSHRSTSNTMDVEFAIDTVPAFLLVRPILDTNGDNTEVTVNHEQDPLADIKTVKQISSKKKPQTQNARPIKTSNNIRKNPCSFTYYNKKDQVEKYKNPFDYSAFKDNKLPTYTLKKRKLVENELFSGEKCSLTNDALWDCKICSIGHDSKESLFDHYEMHKKIVEELEDSSVDQTENNSTLDEEKFTCELCQASYSNKWSLHRHVQQYHRTKENYCEICKRNYANECSFSIHNASHSSDPKTFVCVICKTFSTQVPNSLFSHIRSEHVKEDLYCIECDKHFFSRSWFETHKLFHKMYLEKDPEKHRRCCVCSLEFSSTKHLVIHMKENHGDISLIKMKRYKCKTCNLTLPYQKNLDLHMQNTHTIAEKASYLCNDCGRSCPSQSALTQHMKIHKEGQHICSVCNKKFKDKKSLTIHTRTHTGEKPHKCEVCGKRFAQKPPLTIHLRTHTGERPYACRKCEKGFVTKTIRDYHEKTCKK